MFTVGTEGCPQPLDKPKLWSEMFQKFVSQCLQMDADKRPTASEHLEHEFLKHATNRKEMKKLITGVFVLNAVLPF